MKIDLNRFRDSVSNIKTLTKDIKNTQYIMLDFSSDMLSVCYSDGKSSYIDKIDGESESDDKVEKVIVELDGLIKRLDMYTVSGNMQVDPLSIKLDGVDSIHMTCDKYFTYVVLDDEGEPIDNGSGEALVERAKGNSVKTSLKYYKVDESIKFSMTTRMVYDDIFVSDSFVTCAISELKGLLTKLSKTDGAKDCYVSPKRSAGFAIGTGYTAFLPIKFATVSYSMHTSAIQKLSEILSKIKGETINIVAEDSRIVKICSEDASVGIVFEQSPVIKQHLATLGNFESFDYDSKGLLFNKAAFTDMVRGALLVSGNEIETEIKFDVFDSKVSAITVKKGTGNGTDNLEVFADSVIGKSEEFADFTMKVSLKVLDLILKNCDGNALLFEFANSDGVNYLRLSDLQKIGKNKELLGYYYLCV